MAKQKKQTRYNTIIKKVFAGDGFDEGIARLDSDTLLGFAMALELDTYHVDDAQLIKTLRRLWSSGDMGMREKMVAYLKGLKATYPAAVVTLPEDKEEKLHKVLQSLQATPEEKELLYVHFIEQKPSKINPSKIERFITRHRVHQKYAQVAAAAQGTFDSSGAFEFFHAFDLHIANEAFKKIFVLHTSGIQEHEWEKLDFDALVAILEGQKIHAIKAFGDDISFLIEKLSRSNGYLTKEEAISWLKALEPDASLSQLVLPVELMHRIIRGQCTLHDLVITKSSVKAQRKATFRLTPTRQFVYIYEVVQPTAHVAMQIINGVSLSLESELDAIQESQLKLFQLELSHLIDTLTMQAIPLGMNKDEVEGFVFKEIQALFNTERTLSLPQKAQQKIMTEFALSTVDLRRKHQREALLARTIRDFKALFPQARALKRTIIFHAGPTNSGKTYDAMQALKDADTGVYLAPLRLLALEGYEKLLEVGIRAILLTGEEEIFDEEAGHVSSTIEMADFQTEVDVAVIDEIQMIADRDRGWAWANALIGIPARTVYLTGSLDAVDAIKALCTWLGETLEVKYFHRKARQEVLTSAIPLDKITPGTALIAFSRGDVLKYRQKLSAKYKISVIYGNLSPEVRREEAKRFREGQSELIIATDAIAMGLNLPIKTLLFTKDSKFDGENRRILTPSEVQQIAGRAGRYGMEEVGYIGAITKDVLSRIAVLVKEPLEPIKPPFKVMANMDHIRLVASILQTDNLTQIFTFFAKHMEFDGPFEASSFEGMADVALVIDRYPLSLEEKFAFSTAPVSTGSPYIMAQFELYVKNFAQTKKVYYPPIKQLPSYADTQERLLEVEDYIKEITLYLWLSYRFADAFPDAAMARHSRTQLNDFIERSLAKGAFMKKCRVCAKPLPLDYEFSICQSCFIQQRKVLRQAEGFRPVPKKRKS